MKYEDRIAQSIQHQIDRQTYCKVCGKPIILTDLNSSTYSQEIKNEVHYACYLRFQNENNR